MRAENLCPRPGDWMTVPAGLYAGMDGRVLEVLAVCPSVLRVRLELPLAGCPAWHPVWDEPMSAAEWDTTTDTAAMERYLLLDPAGPDVRRWRLYGCACVRRVEALLPDERWREALDLAERCADGLANAEGLRVLAQRLDRVLTRDPPWKGRVTAAAAAVGVVVHSWPEPG
jgi:hypothetical protein